MSLLIGNREDGDEAVAGVSMVYPISPFAARASRRPPDLPSRLANQVREHIPASLDSGARAELNSLAEERDAGNFAEGLLAWSSRQEQLGRVDAAVAGYEALAGHDIPEAVRARASARWEAATGSGASGLRTEFLLRRLARDASNPVMLAGMTFGSAVFATARAGFLSQLLSRPATGLFARGWGARALASAGAFALEVPAFWAGTKGLNELINPGSQRWDLDTNLRELAGLGITLGALKLTGAAATGLSGLGRNPATASFLRSGPLTAAVRQAGMFTGILLGHRLEEAAGLRRSVNGATTLTDSLAMLIQFNVGGRLAGELTGTRFRAFQQELDLRSRAGETVTRGPSPWFAGLTPAPALGAIGAGARFPARPSRALDLSRPHIMMSEIAGGEIGARNGKHSAPTFGIPETSVKEAPVVTEPAEPVRPLPAAGTTPVTLTTGEYTVRQRINRQPRQLKYTIDEVIETRSGKIILVIDPKRSELFSGYHESCFPDEPIGWIPLVGPVEGVSFLGQDVTGRVVLAGRDMLFQIIPSHGGKAAPATAP